MTHRPRFATVTGIVGAILFAGGLAASVLDLSGGLVAGLILVGGFTMLAALLIYRW